MNALELCDVRAGYEGLEVLHGIDLRVPAGAVCAVLGPNGAGKTTLLRVVCGLLAPTSGDVVVAGEDVTDLDATTRARAGLCAIPDGRGVFPRLTVRDNLWMATFRGRPRAEVEERAFACFPTLAERRDQVAGTLSGGEQQMVALARALVTDPGLVLVDELSTGLAPLVVGELYEHIAALAADGVTVLVVEQFAHAVLPIADLAGVLVRGRLDVGAPEQIADRLHDAYLGARFPTTTNEEPA